LPIATWMLVVAPTGRTVTMYDSMLCSPTHITTSVSSSDVSL
jgi:hypothetical protein